MEFILETPSLFFFLSTLLPSIIISLLLAHFICSYTGLTPKKYHYVLFALCFYSLTILESLSYSTAFSLVYALIRIFLTGAFGMLLGAGLKPAILSSVLGNVVAILCNSIFTPLMLLLTPLIGYFKLYASTAVLFSAFPVMLVFLCFRIILKRFSLQETLPNSSYSIFLVPLLLIFCVEMYISSEVYGNVFIMRNDQLVSPIVENRQLLSIYIFALFSVFCILYSCKKMSENVTAQTRLTLLEQELAFQKRYVEEAQLRYEHTRSMRHDIRNHLSVAGGLLQAGEVSEAAMYLQKLSEASSQLSMPFQTGMPALDVLLAGKSELAQQSGICLQCSVSFSDACAIDPLDLCVIFGNALDNAIKSCLEGGEDGPGSIQISTHAQGDFYMIQCKNTFSKGALYPSGTGIGLTSIRSVASKYKGTITTEKADDFFRLDVLLVNPPQKSSSSPQLS